MATKRYDEQVYFKRLVRQQKAQKQLTDGDSVAAGDCGGLYTISGSSAATVSLPDPADCLMTEVGFKCASAQAHVLSGSTIVFADGVTTGAGTNGNTLTLPAVLNASVILKSDGARYVVLAASGSLSFA